MTHSSTPVLYPFLLLLGFAGCGDGIDASDIPNATPTGELLVDVGGDATRTGGNDGAVPDSVEQVWIRIDEVSVNHETEGWVHVDAGRIDVDLMAHREGDSERIGEGEVYEGAYDSLRLVIVDSWIVVDGKEYDLPIANGVDLDEALELPVAIQVDESNNAIVWVGWDLDVNVTGEGIDWALGTDVNLSVDIESPA